MSRLFTITGGSLQERRALLPEDAKVIRENRNWIIIRSDKTWDELRKIYRDSAMVGLCEQKLEDIASCSKM